MVKKVVNIDATVEKVIEAYRNIPPFTGTDPDERRAYEIQREFAGVQGAMVRFLMEATNRGDDVTALLNVVMSFSAQVLVNLMSQLDKEQLEELNGKLAFPDDPLHSAVHMIADRFGPILHIHMRAHNAKAAGVRNATIGGGLALGSKIDFELEEVGDA